MRNRSQIATSCSRSKYTRGRNASSCRCS